MRSLFHGPSCGKQHLYTDASAWRCRAMSLIRSCSGSTLPVPTFEQRRQNLGSKVMLIVVRSGYHSPSSRLPDCYESGRASRCISVSTIVGRTPVKRASTLRTTAALPILDAMSMTQLGVTSLSMAGGFFLSGAVAIGFSIAFQTTWITRWVQKLHPDVYFIKRTKEAVVALTIDDGPHPDITPKILDVLRENNCKATFFVIGENMDKWNGLVERMHAEGHEVANHTMQDVASWRLSPDEFREQLLEVDLRIQKFFTSDVTGRPIKWFRPGHGFYTSWMLAIAKAQGYRVALGSLFPFDTLFTTQGKTIAKYLLWRMHPGAVLVLHDREPQKDQTVEVLSILLPEMRRRGYEILTLSELHLARP